MTSEEFWQRIDAVVAAGRLVGMSDSDMLTELDGISEAMRERIAETHQGE